MTLDKNALRALAIALCLVLAISAVSCSNDLDNAALEQLSNMQSAQAEENEELSDNVQKYRVVISSGASDEVIGKALELSSAVFDKTEKTCTVVRDTDEVSTDDGTMEIQLGYVERKEAREALGRLNRDDYLCARFSDAVVLGGKAEGATVSATDKFISEILPRAEGKTLMNEGDGFSVSANYDLSAIMLCRVDFGNYDIVCDTQTRRIAMVFRELLANKCGAYPDISSKSTEGVREIIFKLSDGAQVGFCSTSPQGEDVLIESDSVYGLSVAVCKLYDAMSASVTDGVGYIASPLFYSYETTELSVMTAAIDSGDASALKNVLSQLDTSYVDVMTVGIVTKEMWMISESYVTSGYSFKLHPIGSDKYFPVIYNQASFEDIWLKVDETDDTVCVSVGKNENEVCLVSMHEKTADNRQANIDALLDKVGKSPSGVVATFVGAAGYNSEFSVAREGVSVEYLSCVGEGSAAQAFAAMITDKIMDCDEISGTTIEGGEAFCIIATVRNIYCSEFLNLTV